MVLIQDAPTKLGGAKPNNITNKTKTGLGVQLELSTNNVNHSLVIMILVKSKRR